MIAWGAIGIGILTVIVSWLLELKAKKRRREVTEEIRAIARKVDEDRAKAKIVWNEWIKLNKGRN